MQTQDPDPFCFKAFKQTLSLQPGGTNFTSTDVFFYFFYLVGIQLAPICRGLGKLPARNTNNEDMSLAVTCNNGNTVAASQLLRCIITVARDAVCLIRIM